MNVERIDLEPAWVIGVRQVVAMDELRSLFGPAFAAAAASLAAHQLVPTGPATAVYRDAGPDKVDVTIGFPVAHAVIPDGDLVCEALPGGAAVTTVHNGPYEELDRTYGEITGWMVGQRLVAAPVMWEEYLNGPGNESDPSHWSTRIVFPLATS